jgi:hypothetical protein
MRLFGANMRRVKQLDNCKTAESTVRPIPLNHTELETLLPLPNVDFSTDRVRLFKLAEWFFVSRRFG